MSTACAAAMVSVLAGASVLGAQGSVSVQGLGYPTGELSTRAQGTAGALSEIDNRTPLNPAALVIGNPGQVYAQYDPEMRTVNGPAGSSKSTTARFPNFGFSLPVSPRLVVGFSAATLLDRSWATTTSQLDTIGLDTARANRLFQSEGGITDLRFALGYQIGTRLRIGVGGHGYTGSNRITVRQDFVDSLNFRSISQTANTNYRGTALSGGFELDLLRTVNLAVSGRLGGPARMYANDTLLTEARIPNRYAASLSFGGIPQTLVAVRYAREQWSALRGLSTTGVQATDATDVSAGVESAGPRFGTRAVLIRLGARHRGLPFNAGATQIYENSFGGGLGIPLGIGQLGDRAGLDVSLLYSSRTEVNGITEHAYNFSFGLRIQP